MNLHEWITERVEQAEASAQEAVNCTKASRWEAVGSLIVTVPEEATGGDGIIEAAFHTYDNALVHVARHDPAAVLRRCEADRRILARHYLDPDVTWTPACRGCDTYGDLDLPATDNINDCPELLDLAHAHGITKNDLAALDRRQPAPRPAGPVVRYARLAVTPVMTTDQVPEALRGPRWRRHHH